MVHLVNHSMDLMKVYKSKEMDSALMGHERRQSVTFTETGIIK